MDPTFECTAPRKALLSLIGYCRQVTDKRSPIPAISSIKLTLRDATLTALGTDLYQSASSAIDVDARAADGRPAEICTPAESLYERLHVMAEGPVHIRVTGTRENPKLSLSSAVVKRSFTLTTLAAADFPKVPEPSPDDSSETLLAADLLALLKTTIVAAATDQTRANVSSVFLEMTSDRVVAASTDGHRMHVRELPFSGVHGSRSLIIPRSAAQIMIRMLDEAIEESRARTAASKGGDKPDPLRVVLRYKRPILHLVIGARVFSTKEVEGIFPPYDQVIPARSDCPVQLGRKVISDAVRAVRVATDHTMGLTLKLEPGKLLIEAVSPEAGGGQEEIPVDRKGLLDSRAKWGVHANYLRDAVDAIESEEIEIGFSGELDPIVLRPLGEIAGRLIAVIMPMRL